jgi:hypothetical protein
MKKDQRIRCMFCGNLNLGTLGSKKAHFVICSNVRCGATGPVRATAWGAIKAWNRGHEK